MSTENRNTDWLLPLTPVYRAAIGGKNFAYDRGWCSPKHLQWPVVSIGNLSVGGSGKTPLVIKLAQLLSAAGHSVDVLSRGYGRSSTETERVDVAGEASRYGDEPLLIAQKTGVPVYVGASRYEAGVLAEREGAREGFHLLDDGFQHRKLARDVDIVILHSSDFTQRLLPAGRLREPLSGLHRASMIVLRREDALWEEKLRRGGIQAPIWLQHRQLTVDPCGSAFAFCGIARPEEFFMALRSNGVELAGTRAYRDHQAYSGAEMDEILRLARASGAECCVTTEKDAVRLTQAQREKLHAGMPLQVARLEVFLEDESTAMGLLSSLLVRK
jgi:tetraacyldisaccharide 4'-kinase